MPGNRSPPPSPAAPAGEAGFGHPWAGKGGAEPGLLLQALTSLGSPLALPAIWARGLQKLMVQW